MISLNPKPASLAYSFAEVTEILMYFVLMRGRTSKTVKPVSYSDGSSWDKNKINIQENRYQFREYYKIDFGCQNLSFISWNSWCTEAHQYLEWLSINHWEADVNFFYNRCKILLWSIMTSHYVDLTNVWCSSKVDGNPCSSIWNKLFAMKI